MQSSLRTIPQIIAAAGFTVDGREITEQDIDDIVETYNQELYGARINLDHYGSWGGWAAEANGMYLNGCMLGDVISVEKSKAEDGTVVLTAVLCPNESLLKLNAADQAVYYSIEINRDFMKSGKTYLTGLAMTDYPASTRTTRASFNSNQEPDPKLASESNALISLKINPETNFDLAVNNENSGFKNLLKNLFTEKDDEMKPEQLAQLQTALTEPLTQLATGFSALTTSMQSIEEKFKTAPVVDGNEEKPDGGEQANFSLKDNEDFKNVESKINDFSTQLTGLSDQLSKALGEESKDTTDADDFNLGENSQLVGII